MSAGLKSAWGPGTRLLLKGVIKQEVKGIEVNIFLVVNNFQNMQVMKLIFILKLGIISCIFQKWNKN